MNDNHMRSHSQSTNPILSPLNLIPSPLNLMPSPLNPIPSLLNQIIMNHTSLGTVNEASFVFHKLLLP